MAALFVLIMRVPLWVSTAARIRPATNLSNASSVHVKLSAAFPFAFLDQFHVFWVVPVVVVERLVVPHSAEGVGEPSIALAEVPFRLVPASFSVPLARKVAVNGVEPIFVLVDVDDVRAVVHFDAPVASSQFPAEVVLSVNSGAVAASGSGLSWEAVAPVVLEHFKDLPQRVFSGHLRPGHLDDVVVFPLFEFPSAFFALVPLGGLVEAESLRALVGFALSRVFEAAGVKVGEMLVVFWAVGVGVSAHAGTDASVGGASGEGGDSGDELHD